MNFFPWQQVQWQQLLFAKRQNRLPHALLLLGLSGMGKKEFAIAFANTILCKASDERGQPCQSCHACHLMRAHSHPDFLWVEPEKEGRIIKIDQIREAIQLANETPQQGGSKIIIISPAGAMNINAANSLLKTLEEPPRNTLFILISDPSLRLPATITSRCQKLFFNKPPNDLALAWLESQINDTMDAKLALDLAEGAPLKAQDLIQQNVMKSRNELYQGMQSLYEKKADPLQMAVKWQELDPLVFFNLLLSFLKDLLRFQLTQGSGKLVNSDCHSLFSRLPISSETILRYTDLVQKGYGSIVNALNLNRQLLLEELFITWTHHVSC